MKKIFLISLICAYAVSTMGVGFREFYCCGKLKSVLVALTDNNKQQCTKEGCCKTKYQFLKLKENHLASTDIYLPAKHFTTVQFYTPSFTPTLLVQQTARANRSHAPPLYDGTPLYLSNCVFRI